MLWTEGMWTSRWQWRNCWLLLRGFLAEVSRLILSRGSWSQGNHQCRWLEAMHVAGKSYWGPYKRAIRGPLPRRHKKLLRRPLRTTIRKPAVTLRGPTFYHLRGKAAKQKTEMTHWKPCHPNKMPVVPLCPLNLPLGSYHSACIASTTSATTGWRGSL